MTADKWLLYFNGSLYGAEHVTRRCCCLCPGTVRGVWLPVWKGQRRTALRWPAGGHNTFGTLPTLCSAVGLSEKWGLGSATTPLPWVLPGLCEDQEALPWQEPEFLHLEKVQNYSGIDESIWGTVLLLPLVCSLPIFYYFFLNVIENSVLSFPSFSSKLCSCRIR